MRPCAPGMTRPCAAMARYDARWCLNGGTLFGCAGGPDAAAAVVGRHCAAAWAVPLGAERGILVDVEGIRAVVRWKGAGFVDALPRVPCHRRRHPFH